MNLTIQHPIPKDNQHAAPNVSTTKIVPKSQDHSIIKTNNKIAKTQKINK